MTTPNPISPQHPVAIDYAVNGPRTAAAVASGKARLVGMSYLIAGSEPCYVTDDLADALRGCLTKPWSGPSPAPPVPNSPIAARPLAETGGRVAFIVARVGIPLRPSPPPQASRIAL